MKKCRFICCFLIVALFSLAGCKSELKASEYVQANLDLIFQGEISGAKAFIDASDSDLKQMYKNGIYAFVEGYLTGDIDENGDYTDAFAYLVQEIFRMMRYQVEEAEKEESDVYKVNVKYYPVNIFPEFIEEISSLSGELEERMDNGYYEGSQEQQRQSMLTDYLEKSYGLLSESYLKMEYGEERIFSFTVTKNGKNTPKLDEKEINEFIECILALDKM